MVSMKYGRDDELESDKWGVRLMEMAGYDPRSMIGVMEVLEQARRRWAAGDFEHAPEAGQPRRVHRTRHRRGISQRRAARDWSHNS